MPLAWPFPIRMVQFSFEFHLPVCVSTHWDERNGLINTSSSIVFCMHALLLNQRSWTGGHVGGGSKTYQCPSISACIVLGYRYSHLCCICKWFCVYDILWAQSVTLRMTMCSSMCGYSLSLVPSSLVHADELGLSYKMGKTESKLIKTVLESHGFTKVHRSCHSQTCSVCVSVHTYVCTQALGLPYSAIVVPLITPHSRWHPGSGSCMSVMCLTCVLFLLRIRICSNTGTSNLLEAYT